MILDQTYRLIIMIQITYLHMINFSGLDLLMNRLVYSLSQLPS